MAREHVAHIVGLDQSVWPRTLTLKGLVRRASAMPPSDHGADWQAWLEQVGGDRHPSELMTPDPADDIRDAYGMPAAAHMAMTADLNTLCQQLARLTPQ